MAGILTDHKTDRAAVCCSNANYVNAIVVNIKTILAWSHRKQFIIAIRSNACPHPYYTPGGRYGVPTGLRG